MGEIKYGVDKKLEKEANKLLQASVGENRRSVSRDVEKMRYEAGDIPLEDLEHYDPANDWDTQDSGFAILVNPPPGERGDLDWIEPTICADVDDGNVRSRNPKAIERKRLTHIVNDADSWGPTGEEIPLLGVNEGPRKICTKCKRSKGLQYFYEDLRNTDGLHSWCKGCHREHKRFTYENREK